MATTKAPTAPTTAPASVDLAPPRALASTLSLGGFSARVVVSRRDGQPMTEADRAQALELVEASDHRSLSDEEIDRRATAHEKRTAKASPKASTARKGSKR